MDICNLNILKGIMIKIFRLILLSLCATQIAKAQISDSLSYHIEATATAGNGEYAPLWFTANRYGLSSVNPNSALLKAGMEYNKKMNHHWKLKAGLDLATGYNLTQNFIVAIRLK